MIDTHCHVHFRAYKNDMDAVIKRTLQKGVRLITVGTQSTTSKNGIEVAEQYDGVYTTIGLHPNHTCEQHFEDELEEIQTRCESFDVAYYRKLAEHPKVVAIGECGLDYYRIPAEVDRQVLIEKQKAELRKQLALADELNLPVVIHCRDAHADQVAMLEEFIAAGKLARRGVVHCFTGTTEEARAYHALGFLTSFTGIITFPPRKRRRDFAITTGRPRLSTFNDDARDRCPVFNARTAPRGTQRTMDGAICRRKGGAIEGHSARGSRSGDDSKRRKVVWTEIMK